MDKKYFLMGNAHLDPVWQWRVPEGLALVKSIAEFYKFGLEYSFVEEMHRFAIRFRDV